MSVSGRAGFTMKLVREHVGIRDEQWPQVPTEGLNRRLFKKQYGSSRVAARPEAAVAQKKPPPSYIRLDTPFT